MTHIPFCSGFNFGISPDAIFATITSLAVVIISGLAKLFYDKRVDSSNLDDIRTFLCQHLKIILELTNKRIAGYRILADVGPETESHFSYTEVSIPSDYLSQLSQVDLFKSVRRGPRATRPSRIAAYSQLVAALHFVSTESAITKVQFLYFVDHQSAYFREYTIAANAIIRLHREFLVSALQANIPPSEDAFLGEINQIVASWTQTPGRNRISVSYATLIDPVRNVCIRFQSDSRRVELLSSVNDADTAKTNRDRLMTTFADYFREESDNLTKRRVEIEKALKLYHL